ncbi:MAG: hypothetical protein ACE5GN_03835, partial [Waddliaceae bacterium]
SRLSQKNNLKETTKTLLAETLPVEISILLADYKYNERDGIKICEVQQLILSKLSGYDFLYEGSGLVAEKVCDFLSPYQDAIWFVEKDICDHTFRAKFKNRGWIPLKRIDELSDNPMYKQRAALPVQDPHDVRDYHGILYARPSSIGSYSKFRQDCPGIIILDAKTFPYWVDKYKMSVLFSKNQELTKFKPQWGLYPKKYSKNLAGSIIDDIGGEVFVIKPRSSFKGNGIIIAERKELDPILRVILGEKQNLSKNPDSSLSYWESDPSDSFLVEEFVASDPISVPHLDDQPYDGTLRSIFTLLYHKKELEMNILETHWKLPKKSLAEEGSWSEKHKSSGGRIPHYSKVEPALREKVEERLKEAMLLFYRQIRENKLPP